MPREPVAFGVHLFLRQQELALRVHVLSDPDVGVVEGGGRSVMFSQDLLDELHLIAIRLLVIAIVEIHKS